VLRTKDRAGFQPLDLGGTRTQGDALGWDGARLWRWVRASLEFEATFSIFSMEGLPIFRCSSAVRRTRCHNYDVAS
jgi:hypothetical protein